MEYSLLIPTRRRRLRPQARRILQSPRRAPAHQFHQAAARRRRLLNPPARQVAESSLLILVHRYHQGATRRGSIIIPARREVESLLIAAHRWSHRLLLLRPRARQEAESLLPTPAYRFTRRRRLLRPRAQQEAESLLPTLAQRFHQAAHRHLAPRKPNTRDLASTILLRHHPFKRPLAPRRR